jgi:hypothetical protein
MDGWGWGGARGSRGREGQCSLDWVRLTPTPLGINQELIDNSVEAGQPKRQKQAGPAERAWNTPATQGHPPKAPAGADEGNRPTDQARNLRGVSDAQRMLDVMLATAAEGRAAVHGVPAPGAPSASRERADPTQCQCPCRRPIQSNAVCWLVTDQRAQDCEERSLGRCVAVGFAALPWRWRMPNPPLTLAKVVPHTHRAGISQSASQPESIRPAWDATPCP